MTAEGCVIARRADLRPRQRGLDDRVALALEDGERSVEADERLDMGRVAVQVVGALEKRDTSSQVLRVTPAPVLGELDGEGGGPLLQGVNGALVDRLLPARR
jgi:hypothetical protein